MVSYPRTTVSPRKRFHVYQQVKRSATSAKRAIRSGLHQKRKELRSVMITASIHKRHREERRYGLVAELLVLAQQVFRKFCRGRCFPAFVWDLHYSPLKLLLVKYSHYYANIWCESALHWWPFERWVAADMAKILISMVILKSGEQIRSTIR